MDNIALSTPLDLQKALAEEIEEITKDMPFRRYGEEGDGFRIKSFLQDLPIPKTSESHGEFEDENADEAGVFPFPWAIVKLDTGFAAGPSERHRVNVIVVVGVYDDATDRSGYKGVMIALERIMERFSVRPLLAGKFTAVQLDNNNMFRWSLQDEDTYPYYYGALEMAFEMMGTIREDKYA